MRPLLLLMLAGCAGTGSEPLVATGPATTGPSETTTTTTSTGSTTPAPTSTWACRDDVPANQLNGSYPAAELPAPEFTAYNYDGSTRTKADLQGHVTVMWFYPAANTAG